MPIDFVAFARAFGHKVSPALSAVLLEKNAATERAHAAEIEAVKAKAETDKLKVQLAAQKDVLLAKDETIAAKQIALSYATAIEDSGTGPGAVLLPSLHEAAAMSGLG